MFKLNLKIALRSLIKNKGYAFINIVGLSIGMASCILIYMFIHFELSFDQFFAKKDRIYRVITSFDYSGTMDFSQGVPIPLSQAIKNEFSQVEMVAPIQFSGGILKIHDRSGKEVMKTAEDLCYAGLNFFKSLMFHGYSEVRPAHSLSRMLWCSQRKWRRSISGIGKMLLEKPSAFKIKLT